MKFLPTILLLFALVWFGSTTAFAGTDNPMNQGPALRFLSLVQRLDLSADQKKAIGAILKAHRSEMKAKVDDVVARHREVIQLVQEQEQFDEEAVRQTFRLAAAADEEAVVERARLVSEIRPLLTGEQMAVVADMRNEIRNKVDGILQLGRAIVDHWIDEQTADEE